MTEGVEVRVLRCIESRPFQLPILALDWLNDDGDALLDGHRNSRLTENHSMLSKENAFSRSACFDLHLA